MKKHFYAFTVLSSICMVPNASALNSEKCNIGSLQVLKSEDAVTVNMKIDGRDFSLPSDKMSVLVPAFVAGSDTLRLDPITIAGKNAWYYTVRENGYNPGNSLVRAGKDETVDYSRSVPWQKWMENSTLVLLTDSKSSCNCEIELTDETPLARLDFRPRRFNPMFTYVAPLDTAEKRFNLSGRANIRFIVNRTNIDWSYADNTAELGAIMKSVNAVKENPDASVDSILLTGYASPEGPYRNNVRLAKGRTEAVMDYVKKHSSFPARVYHTNSVPEDWGGLKAWLESSSLPAKGEMIKFIDNYKGDPAQENDIFMKRFSSDYPWILKNVYPSLRHTDYRITYTVRKYLNVEEIRKVAATRPQNLSQNELFILAKSYTPGSREYDEVFQLAARLYPDNETANLNAAISSMNGGDYTAASNFLTRAGNSAEAIYARGVLEALKGDYKKALPLIEKAAAAGVAGAKQAIEQIRTISGSNGGVEYL